MTTGYVLGHSDSELKRLIWQSQALRPYTEQLLRMAAIRPGMRVLDVGCGAGDVTMMAARIVGPYGSVTGIDTSPRSLALAARRCGAARLPWVRFHAAALEELTTASSFDAVIGRYVIIHQADPVGFLRAAGEHTAPGGVLAFHEMNTARPSITCPDVPLWRQADDWAKLALSSVSDHMDAGSMLVRLFTDAGLPEPEIRCEVPVGGGADSPLYKYLAETVHSLLPVLSRLGIPEDMVRVDTLEDRLRTAVTQARAQIEWNPQFLAVAKKD